MLRERTIDGGRGITAGSKNKTGKRGVAERESESESERAKLILEPIRNVIIVM